MANMKIFALETQDKSAQQMFAQYAKQLESIHQGLQARCNYIAQEEPQYKVFDNMLNNTTTAGQSQNQTQSSGMNKTKLP